MTDEDLGDASAVYAQESLEFAEQALRDFAPHGGFTIHAPLDALSFNDEPAAYVICACGRGYSWERRIPGPELLVWLSNHGPDIPPEEEVRRVRAANAAVKVRAPFGAYQVESLNEYQGAGVMHPFTCGSEHFPPGAVLIAHEDGWHCPDAACGYRQDWAHAFMTDWSWRAEEDDVRHG
jgi:hypothetical protein